MNLTTTLRRAFRVVSSLLLGAAIGVVLHYALYRMGLPLEPFVYMSF